MEILVNKYLSSIEFYKLLSLLDIAVKKKERILLDFSYVTRIDGNVIPNLIILGKWIEKNTGYIPMIRLGKSYESGYLKKYLYGINFFTMTENTYQYEDPEERYGGWNGKEMDKKNTTKHYVCPYNSSSFPLNEQEEHDLELVGEVVKDKAIKECTPFIKKYLMDFNYGNIDENTNRLADIIGQFVSNSIIRGLSDVYLTLQANYTRKKIMMSISDSGIGIRKAINYKYMKEKINDTSSGNGYFIIKKENLDEKESIIQSIYYRKNSTIYGLYNAIKDILDMNGIIRIHSVDVQLILTKKILDAFKREILPTKINNYNLRKTASFNGLHIEIEIPMMEEKYNYESN